jgi:hypothetical protein
MNKRRALLALRSIDVSYRSAIHHAPASGPRQQEWLGYARQRAEQLLNALEAQLLKEDVDAEVALQLRVVRDSIRRADAGAWGSDAHAPHRSEGSAGWPAAGDSQDWGLLGS